MCPVKPTSIVLAVALALQVIALAGCARAGRERMVDAGGYRLRMLLEGQGSPAVVFVSGGFGGAWWVTWDKVRLKVNEFSRTVIYDRGGAGGSEAAPPPRDSRHIASELHTALRNAGVEPPYVLVGSSLGGIHVRVFAHQYPSDVAGLVLVDPTSEDFEAELIKARGPEFRERAEKQKAEMAKQAEQMPLGRRYEYEALEASLQQARDAWPLPAVPVVLLTSMHPTSDIATGSPIIWLELHKDFLKRVPVSVHIVTEKSGHGIQMEEPTLVVDAIRQIVDGRANNTRRD
jgi:pimeloyl-ACP methyl ester carboxylesterase